MKHKKERIFIKLCINGTAESYHVLRINDTRSIIGINKAFCSANGLVDVENPKQTKVNMVAETVKQVQSTMLIK